MKVITIGRDLNNDVVINDPKVSRHHLQVIQDDYGNFRIADFGSANGTFVNGQKISGEMSLSSNDIVRIGNTTVAWKQYFAPVENRTQINPMPTYQQATDVIKKERHGFITFWFILGIIGSVLSPITAIYQYIQLDTQVNYYRYQNGYEQIADEMESLLSITQTSIILSIVAAIFGIVCIILLFNWKKIGFYGQILSSTVFGGISIYLISKIGRISGVDTTLSMILPIVSIVLGTFIFYAILQIKKNGISCWKQLE